MFYCVVNPAARSGQGGGIWRRLERELADRSLSYEVIFTDGPGRALEAVRERTGRIAEGDEPLDIVVLGGDGTLNEVLSGITDLKRVRLGLVPVGSGNDFARDLELPRDPARIIERICDGVERRRLDVGILEYSDLDGPRSRLNIEPEVTRRFGVSAGIGFDAAVCEEALQSGTKNRLNRLGLGKLSYGAIAVRNIAHAPRIHCDIELIRGEGSESIQLSHFLFIAAMIHHYEGGGFKFAPGADMTDGLFDMCIIGQMPVARMFMAMPFAYFGRHYMFKGTMHRLAREVHIHAEAPLWVHTDGEVLVAAKDLVFKCERQALSMIV